MMNIFLQSICSNLQKISKTECNSTERRKSIPHIERAIDDTTLLEKIPTLAHLRAVKDFCVYYRYLKCFCSEELASAIPPQTVPAKQTRSSTESHPSAVHIEKPSKDKYCKNNECTGHVSNWKFDNITQDLISLS